MKENYHLAQLFQETYGEFLKSIDSFFHDAFKHFHKNGLFSPSIPIQTYETDTEFVIEAELPGVKKEQITLDIFQNHVRIQVKHEEIIQTNDEKKQLVHHQSSISTRERVIPLPYPVTENDVKATYQNGILKIIVQNHRKIIDID